MADQLQLRGGTTAQTAAFTGALREVTVDTDKDTLVVHDSALAGGYPLMRENASNSALALGSAATPSLKFTGDTNTGIYSPGADQLAVATNGTGRLFVGSAGLVGIGTSSPGEKLDVSSGTSGTAAVVKIQDPAGRVLQIASPGASTEAYIGTTTNHRLDFYTNNGVKATLDPSGRLGIGDNAPDSILTVTGGAVRSKHVTGDAGFDFHENGSAALIRQRNNRPLLFYTNNAEVARIDSSGRLLVGTSADSGGALLQVNGDRIRVGTAKTPASASATGTAGEICWDASYIYVCTATNTWKRTAIATW